MSDTEATARVGWDREGIARRAAQDLPVGAMVNLGMGIPVLISAYVPQDRHITLHSEHGVFGLGPHIEGFEHRDYINASGQFASLADGAALTDSATSFGFVKAGYLDVTVLGSLEVSSQGDIANWWTPGRPPSIGGAMDLVVGANEVWVTMEHTDKKGRSKMLAKCNQPLTGRACVTRVYTELGVFLPKGKAFECIDMGPGVTEELVREKTAAEVVFA